MEALFRRVIGHVYLTLHCENTCHYFCDFCKIYPYLLAISLTPIEPSHELLPLFRKVVKYYLVDFAGVSKHLVGLVISRPFREQATFETS